MTTRRSDCTVAYARVVIPRSKLRRSKTGCFRGQPTKAVHLMGLESILTVVVIVLIVLFVLGYFGRGRMRG
jgi:hypothetical protein